MLSTCQDQLSVLAWVVPFFKQPLQINRAVLGVSVGRWCLRKYGYVTIFREGVQDCRAFEVEGLGAIASNGISCQNSFFSLRFVLYGKE
jgi:hypothetical protein